MPDPSGIDLSSVVNSLSRSVVHLTMFFEKQKIATGTGVIFKNLENRGPFLVTAWHNLSGKEPDFLEIKNNMGSLPNKVLIEGHYTNIEKNLYDGDNNPLTNNPMYWRHSVSQHYDVTLLPLDGSGEINASLHNSFLDPEKNKQLQLHVSQTCFIIGFPEGLVDRSTPNLPLPVWKVGNIASEPYSNFCGEPLVLIDATTRRGMSGAPVIVREIQNGALHHRFVGTYVGRYSIKSEGNGKYIEDSAIGRVFKPDVIYDILNGGPNHCPLVPWKKC
ncbi:MAG: hypothetical protein V1746_01100 [bacterium]